MHKLYIAENAPSGDLSEWDQNVSTDDVIKRISETIRANSPGESMHIVVQTVA